MDFKKINKDVDLVKDYLDSKRKLWNEKHNDMIVMGFPIEMYVQDISEENASNGIYSIEKNKWLKKPEKESGIFDRHKVKLKSVDIMNIIDDIEKESHYMLDFKQMETLLNKANRLSDKLKKYRKSGLESNNGEYSTGNLVFKVLRRSDYIEKLNKARVRLYDIIKTL